MRQALFSLCAIAALLAIGAPAVAQDESPTTGSEKLIRLDLEALKTMSSEERRAAMQEYKAAREAQARRRGTVDFEQGGYRPLETPRAMANPIRPKIPGTSIQYDDGVVTGTAGIASQMVGNRFDSALNPPGTMCCFPVETSGTITMVTFDMQATFFSSAVFSIYSNVAGTMASQITSMGLGGIMTGLNTLAIGGGGTANAYMNGTFLAGIWQFDPTMTAIGVGTGTTGGQGFHAISLNDGAVGSMLTDLSMLNAVMRVSGNVATPVELMNFSIEE